MIHDDDINLEEINRVFRTSRVSRNTYLYLCKIHEENREYASVKEISEKIGSYRSSVLGVLRGMGTKYRIECSLDYLGLAESITVKIKGKTVKLYKVTQIGYTIKDLSEGYIQTIIRSEEFKVDELFVKKVTGSESKCVQTQ